MDEVLSARAFSSTADSSSGWRSEHVWNRHAEPVDPSCRPRFVSSEMTRRTRPMRKIAKIPHPPGRSAVATACRFPICSWARSRTGSKRHWASRSIPGIRAGRCCRNSWTPWTTTPERAASSIPTVPSLQGRKVLDVVRYTVHRPVLNTAAGDSPDFLAARCRVRRNLQSPRRATRLQPARHPHLHRRRRQGRRQHANGPAGRRARGFRPRSSVGLHGPRRRLGRATGKAESFPSTSLSTPRRCLFRGGGQDRSYPPGTYDPGIKRILDGRPTYHYVVVGASDPYSPGGFMPLSASPSPRNGGLARSPLTPGSMTGWPPRTPTKNKSSPLITRRPEPSRPSSPSR